MEKIGREELVEMYKPDVERLAKYLPWLTNKTIGEVVKNYEVEGKERIMSFPVYDTVYLNFLKEFEKTVFMNPRYHYVYSHYRIVGIDDELQWIDQADIMTMDVLGGIMSKYALGGRTKAYLWTQALEYHIFLNGIEKARSILGFWDVPINSLQGEPGLPNHSI